MNDERADLAALRLANEALVREIARLRAALEVVADEREVGRLGREFARCGTAGAGLLARSYWVFANEVLAGTWRPAPKTPEKP